MVQTPLKSRPSICLASAALVLGIAGASVGAGEPTVNPTGTWTVTVSTTNPQARPNDQTLKLKFDGGLLTGTLSYNVGPVVNGKARTSELPITEPKLQGNKISFNFTHPPAVGKGPNADYHYEGNINGDTIKGTFTTERVGQSRTRDWEARRVME